MATKPFATGTKVDPFKTLMEINSLLEKQGADQVGTYKTVAREGVAFVREGISYRISVPVLSSEEEARAALRKGTDAARLGGHLNAVVAERARRLRALLKVVHAKIVAVNEDIYTFEEVFGFDAITDNGQTVAERMVPQIKAAALGGSYPSSLPVPGAKAEGETQ